MYVSSTPLVLTFRVWSNVLRLPGVLVLGTDRLHYVSGTPVGPLVCVAVALAKGQNDEEVSSRVRYDLCHSGVRVGKVEVVAA
jgi:hypothetical protein